MLYSIRLSVVEIYRQYQLLLNDGGDAIQIYLPKTGKIRDRKLKKGDKNVNKGVQNKDESNTSSSIENRSKVYNQPVLSTMQMSTPYKNTQTEHVRFDNILLESDDWIVTSTMDIDPQMRTEESFASSVDDSVQFHFAAETSQGINPFSSMTEENFTEDIEIDNFMDQSERTKRQFGQNDQMISESISSKESNVSTLNMDLNNQLNTESEMSKELNPFALVMEADSTDCTEYTSPNKNEKLHLEENIKAKSESESCEMQIKVDSENIQINTIEIEPGNSEEIQIQKELSSRPQLVIRLDRITSKHYLQIKSKEKSSRQEKKSKIKQMKRNETEFQKPLSAIVKTEVIDYAQGKEKLVELKQEKMILPSEQVKSEPELFAIETKSKIESHQTNEQTHSKIKQEPENSKNIDIDQKSSDSYKEIPQTIEESRIEDSESGDKELSKEKTVEYSSEQNEVILSQCLEEISEEILSECQDVSDKTKQADFDQDSTLELINTSDELSSAETDLALDCFNENTVRVQMGEEEDTEKSKSLNQGSSEQRILVQECSKNISENGKSFSIKTLVDFE